MTAMLSGAPSPFSGPGRPLPGGRDKRQEQEREARRLAARLAAAQRRLGEPRSITRSRPVGVIVDLPVTPTPRGTSRMRGAFRRVVALRHPRHRA